MANERTVDFAKSLDELQGLPGGDADGAPTGLVRTIILSRQKPLGALTPEEIGRLVVQMDGLPFILDAAFPLVEADPLTDGGYYPGDILSNLIRADEDIWRERPEYPARLKELYRRALSRPYGEKDAFLESLGIADDSAVN